MHLYTWVQVAMEAKGMEVPKTGVTVICDLPGVGAKKLNQVIWKSNLCSDPQVYLSSPNCYIFVFNYLLS